MPKDGCRPAGKRDSRDYAGAEMVDAVLEANKRLVVRFDDEFWNRGNYDVADELVAADYVRHDLRLGDAPTGPAGQKSVAERFGVAFPDVRLEVERSLPRGTWWWLGGR